jgi:hypothetical protein
MKLPNDSELGSIDTKEPKFLKAMHIFDKTCDDIFELSIDSEEGTRGDYDQFEGESFLVISPKLPEYSNLALLVHKFLYSTNHEACYNS